MREGKRIALPLLRHLSHLIDARYFLDAGIRRRATSAARGRGVGNGNYPPARLIDFANGFDGRTCRYQVRAFDKIVSRPEVHALRPLAILRRDRNITLPFRNRIGNLTGVVVDLKSQGKLQYSGEIANKRYGDAFHVAVAILRCKKSGSRWGGYHSATE